MIAGKNSGVIFLVMIIFTLAFPGCGKNKGSRPTELVFGSEVSGNLGPGEEHFFIIRPTEAGVVVIETLGDLGTRLDAL